MIRHIVFDMGQVLVQFSANYNEIEDVSGLSNLIYLLFDL